MGYAVRRFPMMRRWPRWPSSDHACHLYIGDADRGLCGRRSGDATSSAQLVSCPACWWIVVRAWFRILLGRDGGPAEKR